MYYCELNFVTRMFIFGIEIPVQVHFSQDNTLNKSLSVFGYTCRLQEVNKIASVFIKPIE